MNANDLLLHVCCAPCSVECVEALRGENIEPGLFWYNPNIHLYSEYKSRRDCLIDFAKNENLKLEIDDQYGLRLFLQTISAKIENRCEHCYRLRLERAAAFAAKEGYKAFTTTLLISPYQDHDRIKQTGEEAALKYSVEFLYRDFRPRFREGQAKARAKNFYMQKYCGCVFSEEERFLKITNVELGINNEECRITNEECGMKNVNTINHSSFITNKSFFERLSLLTSENALKKLNKTNVLIFGAGGVGSWAAEALVRSGVGKIGIIDNDKICASNINRQIEATSLTIGLPKASTLKKRLLEINPDCEITSWDELFSIENAARFQIEKADYVIDAIDSFNHKIDLIEKTCGCGVTLFSSMGMALKVDPSKIKHDSVWKTDVCPLARHVRQELRKRGFTKDFTAVYSVEPPITDKSIEIRGEKRINGSIITVTASAGLMLASLVINDILKHEQVF